jgi:hypothetical protein
MRVICHYFLVTKLRVYGALLHFYHRLYFLVLNQTETFLNERQSDVDGQWCPATWGADNSLVLTGRKQATATESFEFHISLL